MDSHITTSFPSLKSIFNFSRGIISDDARLHHGAYVHALASRVLRPNDAKNKQGAGYKTKFLDGRVLSVSTKELKNKKY